MEVEKWKPPKKEVLFRKHRFSGENILVFLSAWNPGWLMQGYFGTLITTKSPYFFLHFDVFNNNIKQLCLFSSSLLSFGSYRVFRRLKTRRKSGRLTPVLATAQNGRATNGCETNGCWEFQLPTEQRSLNQQTFERILDRFFFNPIGSMYGIFFYLHLLITMKDQLKVQVNCTKRPIDPMGLWFLSPEWDQSGWSLCTQPWWLWGWIFSLFYAAQRKQKGEKKTSWWFPPPIEKYAPQTGFIFPNLGVRIKNLSVATT